MIVEALLNLLYGFLKIIFSAISLPGTPESFKANLDTFIDLLSYAKTFLPLFLPINLSVYVGLALALFAFEHLFAPIKWIINKIIEVIP